MAFPEHNLRKEISPSSYLTFSRLLKAAFSFSHQLSYLSRGDAPNDVL